MSTAWTTVKIAVFAPMPRASVAIVTAAKPGFLPSPLEERQAAAIPHRLLGEVESAELPDRFAPGLLRRHSAAHSVVDVHLDVGLELLGHVPLLASPPEESGEPGEEPAHAPHARPSAGARKRGGEATHVSLGDGDVALQMELDEILALDDAMDRLNAVDERLHQIVELRFFGGFSEREIAELLGVAQRTVARDWLKARLFLLRELEAKPTPPTQR